MVLRMLVERALVKKMRCSSSTRLIKQLTSCCCLLITHLYCSQVGLAVEPDWYNVMNKKFQALLDKMEASDMPETAQVSLYAWVILRRVWLCCLFYISNTYLSVNSTASM